MSRSDDPSIGWQSRLPTVDLQIEFFLLKFPDVPRDKAVDLAKSFKKFDSRGVGELQEDEALRLLEARSETKRFVELRQMVKDMDYDHNRELSMLEWACAYYSKSWQVLHSPSANQEEIDAAMAKLRIAMEKEIEAAAIAREKADHAALKQEMLRAKENEKIAAIEKENQRLADQERAKSEAEARRQDETSKGGIKGSAAKFHYAAADTLDTTKLNAARINAEAAARKEQKRLEEEKKRAEDEKRRADEEKERAAERQRIAEEEKRRAEEEKRKAEEGSAEGLRRQQEALKLKAEEDARIAAAQEIERKAKVQAKLKAKFGGNG